MGWIGVEPTVFIQSTTVTNDKVVHSGTAWIRTKARPADLDIQGRDGYQPPPASPFKSSLGLCTI